ncbi:DNA-binding LacI/PurR family transcriptional regulator [Catenuloplanes nepalensis]|uniref:DNA-binding LacI/PurR family transcriptional regulator n=1 Tax=Catenuloplanes nepalensis TaxID=587533 RepID=A0ABT9MUF8_9ACTN|nr:LacI family DNA-binding transcriptional regulator [Catenuloplanes nepalensis]MDP9795028.1 DNA-binding LacI/PurR family transcriptional regulator [Catenuloplanes nepalensis]
MPRVTLKDVARASGVSAATVSFVLNATPGQTIPAETRARVRQAATALGYVPHGIARALREGASRIVLLNAGRLRPGGSLQSFITGLDAELAAHGHTLLVRYGAAADDAEADDAEADGVAAGGVAAGGVAAGGVAAGGAATDGAARPDGGAADGAPSTAGGHGAAAVGTAAWTTDAPVGRTVPPDAPGAALRRVVDAANPRAVIDLQRIYADDESDLRDGGWHDGMAAHADTQIAYLADRGHRRIVFALPPDPALARFAALRLRHARAAAGERGLPPLETLQLGTDRADNGIRLRALLSAGSAPTTPAVSASAGPPTPAAPPTEPPAPGSPGGGLPGSSLADGSPRRRKVSKPAGLPAPAAVVESAGPAAVVESAGPAVVVEPAGPTAVAAFDDDTALRVLAALADQGLRAPEDLAVIGFDDAPHGELWTPALTTVHIDAAGYGRRAGRAALGLDTGAVPPNPSIVIRREST